ncbi:MAG: hypothetical protein KDD55_09260 [Bdellovibrionales bacterium]|nr:hypothetical protein [Bdellovibrionales bacterium]
MFSNPREPERNRDKKAPIQQLSIEVDESYLLLHLLRATEPSKFIAAHPCRSVTAVLADASKASYSDVLILLTDERGTEFSSALKRLHQVVAPLPSFQQALRETLELRAEVELEWKSKARESTEIVRALTGFDIGHDIYRVFITHPSLRNGCYFGDQQIGWGGVNEWPNYRVVYLWHEILHDEQWLGTSDLNHALIELLTDNELRVRLNGGSYPPWEGHRELDPLREKLLPDWRAYLEQDNRDIRKFIASQVEKG